MTTATLLLSDHPICDRAEEFASRCLSLVQVQRHARDAKVLRDRLVPADVLLNFLSAPKVPSGEREKFGEAINFHPAPPEYPGVGSASLAIYDQRTEHGVTAHLMEDQFDTGLILAVRRFPIQQRGYVALWNRSLDECLKLFQDVVRDVSRGVVPVSEERWARRAYTRKEFEKHPSFVAVPA